MPPKFNYKRLIKMPAPHYFSCDSTLDPDTLGEWNENTKPEKESISRTEEICAIANPRIKTLPSTFPVYPVSLMSSCHYLPILGPTLHHLFTQTMTQKQSTNMKITTRNFFIGLPAHGQNKLLGAAVGITVLASIFSQSQKSISK
jgi:hypothetical protein